MKPRNQELEEQRKFRFDVDYYVLKQGGSTDMIDADRVEQQFFDGSTAERAACEEVKRQRDTRARNSINPLIEYWR